MFLCEDEWLVTNGIGGYASATVCGLHTRRYHGLLVAATQPPVGRRVLLSKIDETAQGVELGVNRYPGGVVHPQGHIALMEFRRDAGAVAFVYRLPDGATLEKRIFMVQGENTTVIDYASDRPVHLELRPLVAYRDFHHLRRESAAIPTSEMHWYSSLEPETVESGYWYRNFEYSEEQARGLDFQEDLFQPFVARYRGVRALRIVVSTRADATLDAQPVAKSAAEAFLVRRGNETTILAGYHWFSDWGRDAMIALPGLTLCTGKFDAARSILRTFAQATSQGMLPNRFPDDAREPLEYNTVDATLWMFEAVRLYLQFTGDREFVETQLLPVLVDIIDWHVRGTRYGIRVDPQDGLLACGAPGVQLTWMDAKVGDWVVTPRMGKPVEIQALWYNALRVMETLRPGYRELAERCASSFLPKFWNAAEQRLDDCVGDASMRPNQVFALSLGYSMLGEHESVAVLAAIERELLTPMGLRTLSPRDTRYRGQYRGGVWERDGAYHQGTVWPWLLGPFARATAKFHGSTKARGLLRVLIERVETTGMVPEVADGNAPHRPGGCITQAWSVAELLRAAMELGYPQSSWMGPY